MDDFESPEVQRDFPGLYTAGPSSKNKKEDGEVESAKKDKKKDKKDKDKGYATLAGGDSSPDEDDTKSPSKSTKRIKAFKFPLKKEKREKSRDKDQTPSSTKKEKKEKKAKPSAGPPQDLGEAQPIFGVPLQLALERSRCHDMDNPLPLVVRDCIDCLQENGLKCEGVAESTAKDTKLQHLKKLYNNRESNGQRDLDAATASGLLKCFLRELPEPLLTSELISQFEEVSANSNVQEQETMLRDLVDALPESNRMLLKWIALHLDAVTEQNESAAINAQTLAMLWSPLLQMSHRLFVAILCHCRSLFTAGTTGSAEAASEALPKYIPPLSGANPVLPESRDGINQELSKQESLLSQIHSEMNSGFVTKRREEQLWEVQRIITQLKRKLRQVDKKGGDSSGQRSIDAVDSSIPLDTQPEAVVVAVLKSNPAAEDISSEVQPVISAASSPPPPPPLSDPLTTLTITETGFLALPPTHVDAYKFTELQVENYELHRLRQKLQQQINQERAEIQSLQRQVMERKCHSPERMLAKTTTTEPNPVEVQELIAQNAYLESIRRMLCDEFLAEQKRIVDIRVQLQCVAGV